MCSVNDAVEMTINQFQQNISIKLAEDYLSTLLTGNVKKFPVDWTKFLTVYVADTQILIVFLKINTLVY